MMADGHALMERIHGEYIATQYHTRVQDARYIDHKDRLEQNDQLYRGDLTSLYPDAGLPDQPLVENKYKNALHDISRLSAEAKPLPVWMRRGEGVKETNKARVREQIALTEWEMSGGPQLERKLYMDLAGASLMAVAVYYNDESEYPQVMRLDPRYCYPTVRNGKLIDMMYIETMDANVAAVQFPEVPLGNAKAKDKDVTILSYYDSYESSQWILETSNGGKKAVGVHQLGTKWIHNLKCVPVAYRMLDTFDGQFHGWFDQLDGPMMIRNKIVAYLDDYLEDMVHAPYEAKNVLNSDEPPGPFRVYQHDPNADDSFIRRVAPAAPAGAVFGLIQYMDDQEAKEAIQPPSRVGSVSQSIASGSFVASTQGSLSSAVKECQADMADLRKQFHYIAMKIEEKYQDFEKPLIRSVGKKATYTPSKDIDGNYMHRILFGAAAGVDTQYADVRVLQHAGAGFISKETARQQLDYLDDASSEQDIIDRETTATALHQRFVADPNSALSSLADLFIAQAEGDDLVTAMKKVAPQIKAEEERKRQEAMGQAGIGTPPGGVPGEPGAEAEAMMAGGAPTGPAIAPIAPFNPPPLQQQIVASR